MTEPRVSAGPPSNWTLKPLHVSGLNDEIEVTERGVTLGRDPSNAVVLPAEHSGVSAHHCRLVVRDDQLVVEDLESKNGTLVGGQPVTRQAVVHGDVVELGSGGPRFAVVSASAVDDTSMVTPGIAQAASRRRPIGADTMRMVRQRLGIPEESGVDDLIRARSGRNTRLIAVLAAVIVGGAGLVTWLMRSQERKFAARADEISRDVEERISRHQEEVQAQARAWREQSERFDALGRDWTAEREALRAKEAELESAVESLKGDDAATQGEIEALRGELAETQESLDLYNPVNLEQATLKEVSRVEHCTVLIEAEMSLRDEQTGRELYLADDGRANLDGEGERFTTESNGSGFCLTAAGWVVTNAHVALKKAVNVTYNFGPDLVLQPSVELKVVFSGESQRHAARLVKWVADDDQDLALLKIEPFEDMPYLEPLDLEVGDPPAGSEVFLIGFPLGKKALQQGETVLASTFRGIVSRRVDYYLQVDAAVHPGASGGPLIDGQGRILGVVVGMQTTGLGSASSAIGYVIPIAEAALIWPPPEDAAASGS